MQANDTGPRPPRQLILCCDGTNNTLTGGRHDTNVLKMIGQLVPETPDRLLYYDPGVGAPDQVPPLGLLNELRRRWERIAGLANGRGIYENIAEAYLFLVDHYRSGDQIFLFGFSRGAFTARSVAGMVKLFGIIRADSKPLILTLIRVYFSTPNRIDADVGGYRGYIQRRTASRIARNETVASQTRITSPDASADDIKRYLRKTCALRSTREEVAQQVRGQFASSEGLQAAIHFIGVWDTVASVGITGLRRKITSDGATLDDTPFRHIRHALSMDEHRLTFAPRLYWNDDYDVDAGDPATHRSLRQRWFRGVHSDVGGGYDVREAGLSDQAYRWMLNEAIACGLRTDPRRDRTQFQPKPFIGHDPCYETPWWGVAGLTVRRNVTHRKNGLEQTVNVLTEGVATDPQARMHSVWSAHLRMTHWQTWTALAAAVLLFCWYGLLGAGAMAGIDRTHGLASIWQGAMTLESWKLTYAVGQLSNTLAPPSVVVLWQAVVAMIMNVGLIAAYSWLLGLFCTWAFHTLVGIRNPRDKVPLLFRLGYAPMYTVIAHVLDNILALITLWCIDQNLLRTALFPGFAMLVASVVKWVAAFGSVALIVSGVAAKTWKSTTQVAGTPAR